MDFMWYVVGGVLGGVLGGMGMGGGTILIPLLSIFFNVNQHVAQAVNLIAFIPMAIITLTVHVKNKLVKRKDLFKIIFPGVLFCVLGCFLAKMIKGELLKRIFGGFLIFLSIIQLIFGLKNDKKG